MHLWRRQTNPRVLLHRFEHVVDQALNALRLDLILWDGFCRRAQHRMPQARHLQDGHGEIMSWAGGCRLQGANYNASGAAEMTSGVISETARTRGCGKRTSTSS